MIQRSSSTVTRNVIIGSLSVVVLVTLLYYMKRVEVTRLKKDNESLVVSTSNARSFAVLFQWWCRAGIWMYVGVFIMFLHAEINICYLVRMCLFSL